MPMDLWFFQQPREAGVVSQIGKIWIAVKRRRNFDTVCESSFEPPQSLVLPVANRFESGPVEIYGGRADPVGDRVTPQFVVLPRLLHAQGNQRHGGACLCGCEARVEALHLSVISECRLILAEVVVVDGEQGQ